jgi:hypothetical protein
MGAKYAALNRRRRCVRTAVSRIHKNRTQSPARDGSSKKNNGQTKQRRHQTRINNRKHAFKG